MEKLWGFVSRHKIIIVMTVCVAIIFFAWRYMLSDHEIAQAKKNTDESLSKVQEIIISHDRIVERIYVTTTEEVRKQNVQIQEHVQSLNATNVAVELNTLLNQYRRERSGD